MNFLNKLERKIGKYAIPNLSLWLIVGYGIGFVIQYLFPNLLSLLTLDPYYILRGQVWRIFSWLLMPNESNLFFALIMMVFYYQLGTTLEHTWGTFRFNLYIFGGIFFTIIGAFLLYGICYLVYGMPISMGGLFTTSYINTAIFLAFALCYPNMQVMLYFIIPIKMKWMAVVYLLITGYEFLQGGWPVRVAIIASLLNFIIFFLMTRNFDRISPREVKRRKAFQQQVHRTASGPKHRCAVCGRTDETNPELEFRFCSKCDGNFEYCQEHLFTHEHRKINP